VKPAQVEEEVEVEAPAVEEEVEATTETAAPKKLLSLSLKNLSLAKSKHLKKRTKN
jgi:hypothetical protein